MWSFGEQLRLSIDGVTKLIAAFTNFVVPGEKAIHGADRTAVDAFVEQGGVDFGGGEIYEARLAQQIEDALTLGGDQRAPRLGPCAHCRPRTVLEGAAAMQAGPRQPPRPATGPDQAGT